jgi:hypothetical protein
MGRFLEGSYIGLASQAQAVAALHCRPAGKSSWPRRKKKSSAALGAADEVAHKM